MGGKGGGGPQESTVTQTTTNLPEWVRPYQEEILARAQVESAQPYETYNYSRVADFSPWQQYAMSQMGSLAMTQGTQPGLQEAGRLAYNVGNDSFGDVNTNIYSGYEATPLGNLGGYTPYYGSSGYNPATYGSTYGAGQRQVQFQPLQRESQFAGTTRQFEGFDPNILSRQQQFKPGTLNNAEMLQSYSNPYMQNVVDIEKREAARQADIRNQNIGLEAAKQGGLGGYRDAIMRSENERNLAQQMGDIQAAGQQAAYADAQQMYEADRAARAQKEQFEQSQFGLNAQQAGTQEQLMQGQFGLNAQQEQAREQFMQSQFGQNAEQRQAHEQFMQSQFGLNEQARQAAEQLMQSGYSANQAAQQVKEQLAQSMFQMNQGAQQFGAQQQLQQYQVYEAARQAAAQMGLTAQQANQAGQLALQQNQLGYQQNQLAAANQLAGYSAQDWTDQMERLGILQGLGAQQQQQYQTQLDTAYNQFLAQQSYPWEQLNMYNSILHGGAIQPGTTSAVYGPQASSGQQALGAGIASLGLFQGKGGGA